jgi:hypothetical protein
MSTQAVTPWFSGTIKPVHPGVYERLIEAANGGIGGIVYAHWDGKIWSVSGYTVECAMEVRGIYFDNAQAKPWRGLAQEPNP